MTPPASAPEPTRLPVSTRSTSEPTLVDLMSASPILDHLDSWLDTSPAQFLSMTSALVGVQPTVCEQLADGLTLRTRRPLRALAVAGAVLQRRPHAEPVGIDLPRWLVDLTTTRVTDTRWRPIACDEDWLIEATLPGGAPLTVRLIVICVTGAVADSAVADVPAVDVAEALADPDTGGERFRPADPTLAATCLVDALGRHRISFDIAEPDSCWPSEEALVTWLIALLARQTEYGESAA